MIIDIDGVYVDASLHAGQQPRRIPSKKNLLWPQGEDGTLKLVVYKQDASFLNLSGVTIVLGVREKTTDAVALISRQATITDAANGKAEIVLVQADTINLTAGKKYKFDIQLTDGSPKRWQLVPESIFEIDEIYAKPTDPVTVPSSAVPLALGPSWLSLQDDEPQPMATDGSTTEQVILEGVLNFDDLVPSTLANLFARLSGLVRVTGGTGTIRARYGGTAGAADGTVILTMDPVTGTSFASAQKNATIAKPSGLQLVKITLQQSTTPLVVEMRAAHLIMRGSA